MSTEPAPTPLVMLGAPGAAVCEDDSCLLPGAAVRPAPGNEVQAPVPRDEPGPVAGRLR
jgi:hypothetical protein